MVYRGFQIRLGRENEQTNFASKKIVLGHSYHIFGSDGDTQSSGRSFGGGHVFRSRGGWGSRERWLEEKVLNSISSQGIHTRVTCYNSYCSLIKTGQTNVDPFSIFDPKKSYQSFFPYSNFSLKLAIYR